MIAQHTQHRVELRSCDTAAPSDVTTCNHKRSFAFPDDSARKVHHILTHILTHRPSGMSMKGTLHFQIKGGDHL